MRRMKRSLPAREPEAFRAPGPTQPEALSALQELSRNLWWSWDPEACELWDEVASRLEVPAGERSPRNPVRYLARASARALERLLADRSFLRRLKRVSGRFRRASSARRPAPGMPSLPGPVAYFSMEFGVHESLPIYAGGLGILAGDHAKSASDLALPLIGVGLFYHHGYFRQEIDARGRHQVSYPQVPLEELPLEPLAGSDGRELRIQVELPGRAVAVRALGLKVGRVRLVLLDCDLPENPPRDRAITHRLYGGDRERRIIQEVVCGIGGVRVLRALGIRPAVWHLNEGHVAFLNLERIRELTAGGRLSFPAAAEVVAGDCVFTTHTPVPEGNEVFALDLTRRYLGPHCEAAGIPIEEFLRLGFERGPGGRPIFSMTVLALRLSRFRNGVSALHGEVARRMWRHLWPGLAVEKVPISSITNGIHSPSWVAPELDALYRRKLHPRWPERLLDPGIWRRARHLRDEDLWELKGRLRKRLVEFVRERTAGGLVARGQSPAAARRAAADLLDPGALTICFARRFALYKRAALIFRDRKRARRLLVDRRRPVQFVFAGKPHPEDRQGQDLFDEISAISRSPDFSGRVAILPNYDMEMARRLVQGADLWLNTPRRPLEASGTSGQKVPVNGGLNLSVLDGWWSEGYAPDSGWSFGKPVEYSDPERQDREDHQDLYRVLEEEVVPLYFRRGKDGLPREWLSLVKSSMARLVPAFSSSRMVSEYARLLYRPAAENGRKLKSAGGRAAQAAAQWGGRVERSWPMAHVVRAARSPGGRKAEVDIFVAGLEPGDLAAEVRVNGSRFVPDPARPIEKGVVRFSFPLRARVRARLKVWPCHSVLPHPRECGNSLEAVI